MAQNTGRLRRLPLTLVSSPGLRGSERISSDFPYMRPSPDHASRGTNSMRCISPPARVDSQHIALCSRLYVDRRGVGCRAKSPQLGRLRTWNRLGIRASRRGDLGRPRLDGGQAWRGFDRSSVKLSSYDVRQVGPGISRVGPIPIDVGEDSTSLEEFQQTQHAIAVFGSTPGGIGGRLSIKEVQSWRRDSAAPSAQHRAPHD